MEKVFFSRFKVHEHRNKPFYIRLHEDISFSQDLKLRFLKINKYFVKKFHKVEDTSKLIFQEASEILQACNQPYKDLNFNFEKKLTGLSNKVKRLMLSLKMMIRDPSDPEGGRKKA